MKRCVPSIILALVALAAPSRPAFAADADPWIARYDGGLLPAYSAVWHYDIPVGQQRHMLASDSTLSRSKAKSAPNCPRTPRSTSRMTR